MWAATRAWYLVAENPSGLHRQLHEARHELRLGEGQLGQRLSVLALALSGGGGGRGGGGLAYRTPPTAPLRIWSINIFYTFLLLFKFLLLKSMTRTMTV